MHDLYPPARCDKKADVDKVCKTTIDGVIVALGGKTSDVGTRLVGCAWMYAIT